MLELNELTARLGENRFSFSLQANSHQVSAILGRSGSGKSTLLNLIAGFVKADSGSIHWESESLMPLAANARPVTTLFQQHNLFSHLSVLQNIGLGVNPSLKLTESDKTDIKTVLTEVGLEGFENNPADTLSGGEQQRVALARCLLRKQPILLLDEPFSALDEATRHDMIALTKKVIADRQLCAILVTHNKDDAHRLDAKTYQITNGTLSNLA